MASRLKKSCTTCGKTGKLFKESKTNTVVCSIECAKEVLKKVAARVQTCSSEHVQVEDHTEIGQSLCKLDELIGSERMTKLLKKDQKGYKEGHVYNVPKFIHQELEKYFAGKRKSGEDDEEDDDKEGGEKRKVRLGEEDFQVEVDPKPEISINPVARLLTTRGAVATHLDQILPLDVWKSIFRKGDVGTFDAMFDPYIIRWASEDPIEFIQYVSDMFMYRLFGNKYAVLEFFKVIRSRNNFKINAMFPAISLSHSPGFNIDAQDSYKMSKYACHIDQGRVLDDIYLYIPGVYYADFPDEKPQIQRAIDAGHPVHIGPFPTWLLNREMEPFLPMLLSRTQLDLRKSDVAFASFSKSATFDLYLVAARRIGLNLTNIFEDLHQEFDVFFQTAPDYVKLVPKSIRLYMKDELLTTAEFISNLEKLDDYGGPGVSKVLTILKLGEYIKAYVSRSFPLIDMDELEQLWLENLINNDMVSMDDFKAAKNMLERKRNANKTIPNLLAAKLLHAFNAEMVQTGRVAQVGFPNMLTEEAKDVVDTFLFHVSDASVLWSDNQSNLASIYNPILNVVLGSWILKKIIAKPGFTWTPKQTVVLPMTFKYIEGKKAEFPSLWQETSTSIVSRQYYPLLEFLKMDDLWMNDSLSKERVDLSRIVAMDMTSHTLRIATGIGSLSFSLLALIAIEVSDFNVSVIKNNISAEWIAERCDLQDVVQFFLALFALDFDRQEQKKLIDIYSNDATVEKITESLMKRVWISLPDEEIVEGTNFRFIFGEENQQDMYESKKITRKRAQDMFAKALIKMYQKMDEPDKDKLRDLIGRVSLESWKYGIRDDFIINLAKDLQGYKMLRFITLKNIEVIFNLQRSAFDALYYTTGQQYKDWFMDKKPFSKRNMRLITYALNSATINVKRGELARALRGGQIIHGLIYSDSDGQRERVQYLLKIYKMDAAFENGDTILHHYASVTDANLNGIVNDYKQVTNSRKPDLLKLDSEGVSILGRYYWNDRQETPWIEFASIAPYYPEFSNFNVPHVLLGVEHRVSLNSLMRKLSPILRDGKDASLMNATYKDGRAWWMCLIIYDRHLNNLRKSYPGLITGDKKANNGDNALHAYFRIVSAEMINKKTIKNILHIPNIKVSELNNLGQTPIRVFMEKVSRNETRPVSILEMLVEHDSFDGSVKGKDNLTDKEFAAKEGALRFVKVFEPTPFSASEVKAAVKDVQMDDPNDAVQAMKG